MKRHLLGSQKKGAKLDSILNNLKDIRILLFVKKLSSKEDKNKDTAFYFLGEVYPIMNSINQVNKNGFNYVDMFFKLENKVRQDIYDYLISNSSY